MAINNEKLLDIEQGFKELKSNDSSTDGIRRISEALSSMTQKQITVNVIKPTSLNQECTVMGIYPEVSTIDKIINHIVSEGNDNLIAQIWAGCNSWTIEIDSRILSPQVGLSEKELTALILHEVGHMIYSFSIPNRLSQVVRLKFAQSKYITKQILKDNFFSKVLCYPVLQSCNATNHIPTKNSIKYEVKADNFAIKFGYGKELESAMDKIIVYAGKPNGKKDVEDLAGFSIDTIINLQDRQNHVARKNMRKIASSTPSIFVKKYLEKVNESFSGNEETSVTEAVKDDFIQKRIEKITEDAIIQEGIFFGPKKLKRIDPADIDYIGLEVENIKSNDDKMMIVSYIYNKLDIIDYYIALIDSKTNKYIVPHTRDALVSMRNRLEEYRKAAIARTLPKVEYGIRIQYPEGYEG